MIKIVIMKNDGQKLLEGPWSGHEEVATDIATNILKSITKRCKGLSVMLLNKKGNAIAKKSAEQFLKDGGEW